MTDDDASTILVVEDDDATRTFLADNLSADGYDLLVADCATDALSLFERKFPDLALVDLNLPDASGFELLRRVRSADGVVSRVELIYKSTSGVRSIAGLLGADHETRLGDVANCPTQFQQYIAGTDHRVHVVGDDVFACRIDSGATDYRYALRSGHTVGMHSVDLPDEVAARCVRLTAALGLRLAGVDLRVDAHGRWWCFEVNTSPGFVWFEDQTGQPIAAAVASLLSGGLRV